MKSKLTIKGPGMKVLEDLGKAMARRPYFRVGVMQGEHAGSDLSNAELAAIHEFGAPRANIPERSFLRSTADKQREVWITLIGKLIQQDRTGPIVGSVFRALELVGQRAVADTQRTIRNGIDPPLQPATIARKGSSKPLIDTGRLLQSISYEVVRDGLK